MYFRLFILPVLFVFHGYGNAQSTVSEISEEVISSLAAEARPRNQWGGRVVSFSRNLQSYDSGAIGSIRASVVSFSSEEKDKFISGLMDWYGEKGFDLELKSTSLKASKAGDSNSLTFLLSGNSSQIFISIIFLDSSVAPSILVGPKESVDNYLFLFHYVEE